MGDKGMARQIDTQKAFQKTLFICRLVENM
jgi:hypothetical protein